MRCSEVSGNKQQPIHYQKWAFKQIQSQIVIKSNTIPSRRQAEQALWFLPPLLFLWKRRRKLSPPLADPRCTPAEQSIHTQGTLRITSNSGHKGQHIHILAHPCTYERKLENTSCTMHQQTPVATHLCTPSRLPVLRNSRSLQVDMASSEPFGPENKCTTCSGWHWGREPSGERKWQAGVSLTSNLNALGKHLFLSTWPINPVFIYCCVNSKQK
jgi:hypothetical protein